MRIISNDEIKNHSPRPELPPEFLARYAPFECFAHNSISETYLVKDRESGEKCVAKIFDSFFVEESTDERVILERLDHPALPRYIESIEAGEAVCVVRDYAEGKPLDKLDIPVSEHVALAIGLQLCDILTYLHNLNPPVIHRDIKPSNVIIDENNSIRLIDFDISREFDAKALRDTTLIATDGFAPPEQYGYQQTNAQADVFSFGKLMCWLMTGSNDVTETEGVKNRALAKIILKCTAFAPKDRYQTAGAVKSALLRAGASRQGVKRVAAYAAGLLLLTGSFILGRITAPVPESPPLQAYLPVQGETVTPPSDVIISEEPPPDTSDESHPEEELSSVSDSLTLEEPPPASEIHIFKEPLIEQAARFMLDKDDDEPITYGELETIEEINIHRLYFVRYHYEPSHLLGSMEERGDIESLDDLRYMKNLIRLSLSGQPLSDLSPLAANEKLEYLFLTSCDVTDLSILAGFKHLTEIHLGNLQIEDFSVIGKIENLAYMHIGVIYNINSISDFGPLPNARGIHIYESSLASLNGITDVPLLEGLGIRNSQVTDFSLLNDVNALPDLWFLQISEGMTEYLHTLTREDMEIEIT